MTDHRFGGEWTATKLALLREYLHTYSTALKSQPFNLRYIDAFAGAGDYVGRDGNSSPGSARIALEVEGFSHYTFIERRTSYYRRLEVLKAENESKSIRLSLGDANDHLAELCAKVDWKSSRGVLFLDPYGMQVSWQTLQCIRRTGAIDVWYLVPLNGLLRQMTRDPKRRDASKDQALDRLLGTPTWRTELYAPSPQIDLWGQESERREEDPNVVIDWLTKRLESEFPLVLDPVVLRRGHGGNPHAGPRLFALYFMISNPVPKARGLARNLAKGVIDRLRKDGAVI